ncbi:alpha/beta fold hydrolase [Streptomyces sp. NPDC087844]|uniref:alpha/beta fold hydrolase n=1 Tax=Streptomyces sp. NPDC087844 TaxID=3365805 RepID=UPI0038214EAF
MFPTEPTTIRPTTTTEPPRPSRAVQPLPIDPHAPFDERAFFQLFRHDYAHVNGVRLHYVIGGPDPKNSAGLVVLLHGWPQTWHEWRKIMPALAEKYTVVAPDIRGTGDSDKPLTGYDAGTLADDTYQLVRHLGFDSAHIVAYDVSGRSGYAYAVEHPEALDKLVFMETLIPGFGLEAAMDVANGGSYHFGFHATVDLAEALVRGKERFYITTLMRSWLHDKAAMTEGDFDEFIRCYSGPGGLRGGFSHYRAFLSDPEPNRRRAAKGKLTVPVLALYGGSGGHAPTLPRDLTALAENVEGEGVPGAGHLIAEERPDYLAARLLDFFGE